MKIDAGEKVVTDSRVDFVHIAGLLADRAKSVKDEIKEAAAKKKARYVRGDHAIGRLQGGGKRKRTPDPTKLHALVKSGKITLDEFLSVVSVKIDPLKEILSGPEIIRISKNGDKSQPSLVTEFEAEPALPDWEIEDLIRELVGRVEELRDIEKHRIKSTASKK